LHADVRLVGRQAAVVGRVLLGREGVQIAADAVDRRGQLPGSPGLGALEQQVLEEVGDARQRFGLVPRADGHPDAGGDGVGAG